MPRSANACAQTATAPKIRSTSESKHDTNIPASGIDRSHAPQMHTQKEPLHQKYITREKENMTQILYHKYNPR